MSWLYNYLFSFPSSTAVGQCSLLSPALWSRLKYLNNCQVECYDVFCILYIHGPWVMNPNGFGDILTSPSGHHEVDVCGFEVRVLKAIVLIVMKFVYTLISP